MGKSKHNKWFEKSDYSDYSNNGRKNSWRKEEEKSDADRLRREKKQKRMLKHSFEYEEE